MVVCLYVVARRRAPANCRVDEPVARDGAYCGSLQECPIGPCRSQTLPGPSPPVRIPIRWGLTDLDGHPCVVRPRVDADAGIRTRVTTVTGSHARRTTPRRHVTADRPGGNRTPDLGIQSPVSLASGDSGAADSRGSRTCTAVAVSVLSAHRSRAHPGGGDERTPECRERTPVTCSIWVVDAPGDVQAAGPCSPAPDG